MPDVDTAPDSTALRRAESRKRLEGEGWVFREINLGGDGYLVNVFGPGNATTKFTSDESAEHAIDKAIRYASMSQQRRKRR